MALYVVHKVIEADGWTDEGKAIIEAEAQNGFGVVKAEYFEGIVKVEIDRVQKELEVNNE